MSGEGILQMFGFLLPAVVTGVVAFYFFKMHTKNEEGRRRFLLHKDSQKSTIPVRLQAYERMALFLERIAIPSLVVRVAPKSSDKNAYESLLIKSIETEFEHNLSQQIYMTDECWNVIKAAKSATVQMIRKAAMSETESADKLREDILTETMEKQSPSGTALSFIKKEIKYLWE
ncbi:hypothetical protein SAMN05421766_103387 [Zobellia uliginosa]|uniref:Uncharacterized protein n=1 Tax=Zobellia uliginosa TaxID=143224 RepID=A0ABY1KUY6_9FLAO|nr:hypothetical protein [Zobellia uliginosa]MDO6516884.1 hypothetical protein [Zobellia uliginosa]SIS68731.1 hypothetical protein SAMN05421766_103387 [Zobellia uliginosa]